MQSRVRLTASYTLFAAIAIAANLGTQAIILERLHRLLPQDLLFGVALVLGTGVGLVVKYVLDKRYIFEDASTGTAVHLRKFSLYTMTGLVTTAIFWGAEIVANHLDPGGPLIYAGGALGLTAGYILKYRLDRRFAFRAPS